MYKRFMQIVRAAGRARTAGEGASTRARKVARLAARASALADGWSGRALGALVRIGPDDPAAPPRARLLDAVGAGAATALAAGAFECALGEGLDEGAPEWRNAARALAYDWMDGHGGVGRWVRTLERIVALGARADPCMLPVARVRALASLTEAAWQRLEGEPRGLRAAALGEAPVAALEAGRARWMGAIARERLTALGAPAHTDEEALERGARRWPWPQAEPPLATLALLGGEGAPESAAAWAGAERLERQPERVREVLRAHAHPGAAAEALRAEIAGETERMRGLIEGEARAWTQAQGRDEAAQEAMRARWRAARRTLGEGVVKNPTPTECCAQVGWRIAYDNPLAIAAAAQMAHAAGGDDAAVIATWAYGAVVREGARAAGFEGTVFLTPWTGTRLGAASGQGLTRICTEERTRWSARRYEALAQALGDGEEGT